MAQTLKELVFSTSTHIIYIILTLFFLVAGIFSNVLVCVVMKRSKRLLTVLSNYFILQLSAVEIILRFFQTANTAYAFYSSNNFRGKTLCITVETVNTVFYAVIFCLLAGVAVDRFVNIVYPFKGRKLKYKKLNATIIVWLYAFITAVLTAPFITEEKHLTLGHSNRSASSHGDKKSYFCMASGDMLSKVLNLVIVLLHYVAPLVLIIICYDRIWNRIRQKGRQNSPNTMSVFTIRKTSKTLKMFGLVIALYALCLVPKTMMRIVGSFELIDDDGLLFVTALIVNLLDKFSSLLNPLIYAFYNPAFRRELFNVLNIKKTNRHVHSCCSYILQRHIEGASASAFVSIHRAGEIGNENMDRHTSKL